MENMDNIVINIRDEKIKDFFRFKALDNYFCIDTKEEIEQTKLIWVKYAHDLLNQKIYDLGLKNNEEEYLKEYFSNYLFETEPTHYERLMRSYYIKYRMSKEFEYNKLVNNDTNLRSELYAKGKEEFALTLKLLISEMYIENEDREKIVKAIFENISEADIALAYLEYIQKEYDIKNILTLVKNATTKYETSKLDLVRKKGISEKAVIYTIEGYLEGKIKVKGKVGQLYSDLYKHLLENKQMAIDGVKNAFGELLKLKETINNVIYNETDNKIDEFIQKFELEVRDMEHYKNGIDNSAAIYKLYLNGLKAMPRSRVTNVTKYFAINGTALSVIEMNTIIENYKLRIIKAKDLIEQTKIKDKLKGISEVIDFVKSHSVIYTIEELLINETNPLRENVISLISNNYGAYQDMKYKLTRLYENLDNVAGSGSPTKVNNILIKKNKVLDVLEKCKLVDEYFNCNEELSKKVNLVEENSDIVIKNVRNYNKAIAVLQEITGKGIVTCKALLDESIKNGVPVIRDLDEQLNTFVYKILENKGARRNKKQK